MYVIAVPSEASRDHQLALRGSLAALAAFAVLATPRAAAQCTVELVNVDSSGVPGEKGAGGGAVSADGRYVVFSSTGEHLVEGDVNDRHDVFVHDLVTGQTTLESRSSSGEIGDGVSTDPVISGTGRFVAFRSGARNFEPTPEGSHLQVYLRDRHLGTTIRVSESTDGTVADDASFARAVSDDGRFVCFDSEASNLVTGDTNGVSDVFVYDALAGQLARVSVSTSGAQAIEECSEADMSADGRWIVFVTRSANLDDDVENGFRNLFLHDRVAHTTERIGVRNDFGIITEGNALSRQPAISRDGSVVAFLTQATNLVEPDTNDDDDILIWERADGALTRASQTASGEQANDGSTDPSVSPDGWFVAFRSGSTNLIDDDVEGWPDHFLLDRRTRVVTRITENAAGEGADANAPSAPAELAGGACVATFLSDARNLGEGDDTAGAQDLFARRCPPPPLRHCVATVNSSGNAARIDFAGAPSLAANDFELHASGCPSGQFALLFAGPRQTILAFGDGYLCAAPGGGVGIRRLGPPLVIDGSGAASRALDFTATEHWIESGSIWHFQFWYRDPGGSGGSGFNLTDALGVVFGL